MSIREFFCELEYGLMLFHVSPSPEEDDTDKFLRSNLISALYSFAKQVENDTIDALRMGKVTFLFKKRKELIFILTLDTTINPLWWAQLCLQLDDCCGVISGQIHARYAGEHVAYRNTLGQWINAYFEPHPACDMS